MTKMYENENWTCKCSLEHKITNKQDKEKKYKPCIACGEFPSETAKDKSKYSKIERKI